MHSGLLWYDAAKDKDLEAKVHEAAQRFFDKFGVKANRAFVNSDEAKAFATGRDPLTYHFGLAVIPKPTILPHHVWVGVEEELAAVR